MKLKWLSVFSIFAAFVMLLLVSARVQADVRDNANIFSPSAVENANNAMKKMERVHNKQFVIETFAAIPDAQKDAATQSPDTFFKDWMSSRAKELKVNGVYAMICMDPRHLEVAAGKSTISRGDFSEADVKSLYAQLKSGLHDKQYDKALTDATDTVERAYTANISEPGNRSTANGGDKEYSSNSSHMPAIPGMPGGSSVGGVSLGSMICLGIAAIIIFSLIKSVFRGNSNNTYGGGNYPPGAAGQNYGAGGGGFGYGGGGGGGFGKGFLGGLLGGALGGYAADRFDHRNDQSNAGLSQGGGFGGGNSNSSFDSGPSDAGQGFGDSGVGGDFGSSGGGDSGGGGGSAGGDF